MCVPTEAPQIWSWLGVPKGTTTGTFLVRSSFPPTISELTEAVLTDCTARTPVPGGATGPAIACMCVGEGGSERAYTSLVPRPKFLSLLQATKAGRGGLGTRLGLYSAC